MGLPLPLGAAQLAGGINRVDGRLFSALEKSERSALTQLSRRLSRDFLKSCNGCEFATCLISPVPKLKLQVSSGCPQRFAGGTFSSVSSTSSAVENCARTRMLMLLSALNPASVTRNEHTHSPVRWKCGAWAVISFTRFPALGARGVARRWWKSGRRGELNGSALSEALA